MKQHKGTTQNHSKGRNRTRVLISTDCFLPRWDGVSRFLAEAIPPLCKDFDVTVACPHFGPSPGFDARMVKFSLYPWRVGDINIARVESSRIKNLVAESDVVFNQTLGPIGSTTLEQAHRMGKPVISFIHSIDWELFSRGIRWGRNIVWHFTKWYESYLYNRCKMLLVPSREVWEVFERAGISTKKLIVPLGVNGTEFCPAPSKASAKRKIGMAPDKIVVGFSGRIAREKDLPTLKKAFDSVRQQHPSLTLLIVGTGVPSEERKISGPGVIMAGMSNNVAAYLQAMDIFVLPSLTETSSLATMEAMACGLPVISTPVGRIKEYITPGKNGLLFPKGNAKALAFSIALLVDDPHLRERLGRAARQTAMQRFQWSQAIREIVSAVKAVKKKAEPLR